MFAHSMKIMTLQGFDIRVDPSWLLIAALITWSLATQYFPEMWPGAQTGQYLFVALFSMLGFFASLILHELAHSLMARHYNVEIKSITLFVFGGVAELGSEPRTAGHEFLIALAGPVMSLALALGFWFAGVLLSAFEIASLSSAISYLALVNLVLALFNLLPAFPLDGGRILRAYLWARGSDFLTATRIATQLGGTFAYALMALGVLTLFAGGIVTGLWQIFIGAFLLAAARGTYHREFMKSALQNQTVATMMNDTPIVATPELTLSSIVNQIMLRNRITFVPVVEDGVLLGYLDGEVLSKIDREHWHSTQAGDVYVPLNEDNSITAGLPADQVMQRMTQTGHRKLMVVQNGRLLGVITLSDLLGYLAVLQQTHMASAQ